MSVSGNLYGLEPASQSRMNRKSLFVGTGAEIAAVPLTNPATMFLCTATGAGYTENEVYVTKADGSGRIALRRSHKHNTSLDEDGGSMYDIDTANVGSRIAIDRLTKGGFFVVRSQTTPVPSTQLDNAIISNAIATRLLTATTLNNFTQLEDGGISLSFANKIEWRIKMEVFFNASPNQFILFRQGVNMEPVDIASNTSENRFGMEGCDSDGTNIRLICCNGSARTNTNTGILMNVGMRGYKMLYTPGTNIVWTDSTGNQQTLSTNIPSSGSIASDRLLRYGVKLANATTGGQRGMYIARDTLFGRTSDTLWVA